MPISASGKPLRTDFGMEFAKLQILPAPTPPQFTFGNTFDTKGNIVYRDDKTLSKEQIQERLDQVPKEFRPTTYVKQYEPSVGKVEQKVLAFPSSYNSQDIKPQTKVADKIIDIQAPTSFGDGGRTYKQNEIPIGISSEKEIKQITKNINNQARGRMPLSLTSNVKIKEKQFTKPDVFIQRDLFGIPLSYADKNAPITEKALRGVAIGSASVMKDIANMANYVIEPRAYREVDIPVPQIVTPYISSGFGTQLPEDQRTAQESRIAQQFKDYPIETGIQTGIETAAIAPIGVGAIRSAFTFGKSIPIFITNIGKNLSTKIPTFEQVAIRFGTKSKRTVLYPPEDNVGAYSRRRATIEKIEEGLKRDTAEAEPDKAAREYLRQGKESQARAKNLENLETKVEQFYQQRGSRDVIPKGLLGRIQRDNIKGQEKGFGSSKVPDYFKPFSEFAKETKGTKTKLKIEPDDSYYGIGSKQTGRRQQLIQIENQNKPRNFGTRQRYDFEEPKLAKQEGYTIKIPRLPSLKYGITTGGALATGYTISTFTKQDQEKFNTTGDKYLNRQKGRDNQVLIPFLDTSTKQNQNEKQRYALLTPEIPAFPQSPQEVPVTSPLQLPRFTEIQAPRFSFGDFKFPSIFTWFGGGTSGGVKDADRLARVFKVFDVAKVPAGPVKVGLGYLEVSPIPNYEIQKTRKNKENFFNVDFFEINKTSKKRSYRR